jgi:hypothetical protein
MRTTLTVFVDKDAPPAIADTQSLLTSRLALNLHLLAIRHGSPPPYRTTDQSGFDLIRCCC